MWEIIYNFFVRRDERIQYEYERYVQEHIDEHYTNRLKHRKILWELIKHYQIKKKNEPLLYWDNKNVIDEQNNMENSSNREVKVQVEATVPPMKNKKIKHYPESEAVFRKNWRVIAEELMQYDIISFDMFDTIALRNINTPKDVFHLLSCKNNICNFLQLRVEAEEEARQKSLTREVYLDDIYEILHKNCGIDVKIGIENELDVEYAICEGNPYICNIIHELHKNNKKIIIITDTYFTHDFIRKLLDKFGIDFDIEIYCSCEYKRGKYHDGALFEIAESNYPLMTRYVHVGDNKKNDVEIPHSLGWDAIHYIGVGTVGAQYRNKKQIGVNSAIYKGIINNQLHNGILESNIHYEYGFTYGGWIACGFCKWLNKLAKTEKIDKFLFMSRDGFYIQQVYNKYYKEVDNEYITISRYTAMQLSFNKYTDNFINFNILRRANENEDTIGMVLEALEMDVLKQYLWTVDLKEDDLLNKDTFPIVKALVYAYKDEIWESFKDSREAAIEYFRPFIEGAKKICLVDVGWNGTSVIFMKHFFEEVCGYEIECIGGLVAGAFSRFSTAFFGSKIINSYIFSPSHNRDLFEKHDFAIHNLFMEILFTEPAPSFINFKLNRENGSIKKIYAVNQEENNEMVRLIGLGILDFAEKYNSTIDKLNLDLEIEARNVYEPLFEAMQNREYMYSLFQNYSNQVLPGTKDTAEKVCTYLKRKNYVK